MLILTPFLHRDHRLLTMYRINVVQHYRNKITQFTMGSILGIHSNKFHGLFQGTTWYSKKYLGRVHDHHARR